MRKLVSAFIGLACFVPLVTAAATQEEIRQQIVDLLNRVTALQAQIQAQGTATTTSQVPAAPGGAVACPHVSRSLKKGSSGADVTRLQQFLALDPSIYPEGQITGYYGPLTEAAIKRFQCKFNIACSGSPATNGYGVTGPRTAALLALQCSGVTANQNAPASGFIRVTPTGGPAPLSVTVEAYANTAASCTAASYEVNFGDGTIPQTITVPQNACQEIRQVFGHSYTIPGTYTIALRSGVHQVTSTVLVTPGSGSGGNASTGAFNITASAGLMVQVAFEVGSACSRFDLDWGDGSAHMSQDQGNCTAGVVSKQFTHTYQSAGAYTVTLRRGTALELTDSAAVSIVQ